MTEEESLNTPWAQTAAQYARNAEFYRELLMRVSAHLGKAVYVSDDGSRQDEPLLLKVPELVAQLVQDKIKAEAYIEYMASAQSEVYREVL